MSSTYLEYVEEDDALRQLVVPLLPQLKDLDVQQVEILVFFLKSLHTYYPNSESHVANYEKFGQKLEAIRTNAGQIALQKKAARLMFAAMVTGGFGIVLLLGGLLVMFSNLGWGLAAVVAALGVFAFAEARFGKAALVTSKEQDRRYFLESLRQAQACNELDWAGLFSHNGVTHTGASSDADILDTRRRVAQLSAQLRSALYNDEYFAYSRFGSYKSGS